MKAGIVESKKYSAASIPLNINDLQRKGFAFYSFEDNAIDKVGGHDGTVNGGVTYITSANGKGAFLNGDASKSIVISNSDRWTFNGAFAIKLHLNLHSLSGTQWIVSKRTENAFSVSGAEYQIFVRDNKMWFAIYSDILQNVIYLNFPLSSNISINNDYCLIFEYDGSLTKEGLSASINNTDITVTKVVDGVFTGLVHGTSDIYIGRDPFLVVEPFNGVIDELYFFNDVLTANEKTFLQNNFFPFFADSQTPAVPIAISKTWEDHNSIKLEWETNDDIGVVKHNIYKDGVLLKTTPNGDPYTYIGNLDNAVNYSFTISAIDYAGNESAQSVAFVTTANGARPAYLDNIISYYRLSDNGTDEESINDLTALNITYADSPLGRVAVFNGTNSQMYANSAEFDQFGTQPLTQVVLVKINALPPSSKQYQVTAIQENTTAGTNDKNIRIYSDGRVGFYAFDGAQKHANSPAGKIEVGKYYLIVGRFTGTRLQLLLDGIQLADIACSSTFNFTNPRFVLSANYGSPSVHFNGEIYAVGLFDASLDDTQVKDLKDKILKIGHLI